MAGFIINALSVHRLTRLAPCNDPFVPNLPVGGEVALILLR